VRDLGIPLAIYIAIVSIAFLIAGIAWSRFFDSYFRRYFPEDNHSIWRFVVRHQRERFAPLRSQEDPQIEHRRRQLLLALAVPIVLVIVPFALSALSQP
jgi:hypothetical protein